MTYHFDYGSSTANHYGGKQTKTEKLKVKNPWGSEEVEAEIPITEFEETVRGTCPKPLHFTLTAKNQQGESLPDDQKTIFVVAGR